MRFRQTIILHGFDDLHLVDLTDGIDRCKTVL